MVHIPLYWNEIFKVFQRIHKVYRKKKSPLSHHRPLTSPYCAAGLRLAWHDECGTPQRALCAAQPCSCCPCCYCCPSLPCTTGTCRLSPSHGGYTYLPSYCVVSHSKLYDAELRVSAAPVEGSAPKLDPLFATNLHSRQLGAMTSTTTPRTIPL